ncbi:MAG: rumB [Rhodocyclaceae bacterium]|nr:MAG: rumB [Rhodocyclaceae bacterium]
MPIFGIFDNNNFYASCEKLFAPRLKDRPVVVLSNNDGCVVARSAEAKALGIPMGAPWFKLQDLARQHEIVAFSSNYELYADLSDRVVQVLRLFTPNLEVYSIDESFLSLDGFSHLDLADYGRQIRERVLQWVGLPGCVGIGPTKTMAKLANHCAKNGFAGNDGVCNLLALSAVDLDDLFGRIKVGEVWGVGRKIDARLQEMGISSVRDLRDADPAMIRSRFSVVLERTVRELNGVSCLSLKEVAPDKQQIMCSRSFGEPVYELDDLLDAVATYMSRAAEKLRQQQGVAAALMVFLQTNPFKPAEPQYHPSMTLPLPDPTSDTRVLVQWGLRVVKRLYRRGYAYKKAGVMLSGIQPEGMSRGSLFDSQSSTDAKAGNLMALMDGINQKWGRGAIRLATEQQHHPWQMRRDRMSPRYTTSWDELPGVLAK